MVARSRQVIVQVKSKPTLMTQRYLESTGKIRTKIYVEDLRHKPMIRKYFSVADWKQEQQKWLSNIENSYWYSRPHGSDENNQLPEDTGLDYCEEGAAEVY
jgi:hypothetical protein